MKREKHNPFKRYTFAEYNQENVTASIKRTFTSDFPETSKASSQDSVPASLSASTKRTKSEGDKNGREMDLFFPMLHSVNEVGGFDLRSKKLGESEDFNLHWRLLTSIKDHEVFPNPLKFLDHSHRFIETGMLMFNHLSALPVMTEAYELLTRVLIEWFSMREMGQARMYKEGEEIHRDCLEQIYRCQTSLLPLSRKGHDCESSMCGKKDCVKGRVSTACMECGCDLRSFAKGQKYFSSILGFETVATGDAYVCRKTGRVHLCGRWCEGDFINDDDESVCSFTFEVKDPFLCKAHGTVGRDSFDRIQSEERSLSSSFYLPPSGPPRKSLHMPHQTLPLPPPDFPTPASSPFKVPSPVPADPTFSPSYPSSSSSSPSPSPTHKEEMIVVQGNSDPMQQGLVHYTDPSDFPSVVVVNPAPRPKPRRKEKKHNSYGKVSSGLLTIIEAQGSSDSLLKPILDDFYTAHVNGSVVTASTESGDAAENRSDRVLKGISRFKPQSLNKRLFEDSLDVLLVKSPPRKIAPFTESKIETIIRESTVEIGVFISTFERKVREKIEAIAKTYTNRENSKTRDFCTILSEIETSERRLDTLVLLYLSIMCQGIDANQWTQLKNRTVMLYKKFVCKVYSAFKNNEDLFTKKQDHHNLVRYLLMCISRTQERKNHGLPVNTTFLNLERLMTFKEFDVGITYSFLDGFPGLTKTDGGYHQVTFS